MAQGLGFGVCRLKEGLVPLARPAVVWPSPMDLHQRLEHPPIPTPSPLSVTPCLLQKAPNIHDGVRWRLLHLRPDLRFYGVTEHVVLPKTISAPTKKTPHAYRLPNQCERQHTLPSPLSDHPWYHT